MRATHTADDRRHVLRHVPSERVKIMSMILNSPLGSIMPLAVLCQNRKLPVELPPNARTHLIQELSVIPFFQVSLSPKLAYVRLPLRGLRGVPADREQRSNDRRDGPLALGPSLGWGAVLEVSIQDAPMLQPLR